MFFSYELCVAKDFFREPQIRFHRSMENVRVLYVMFTIMFNVIFVFLLAFYVFVKLSSFISVHNTVQSDYIKDQKQLELLKLSDLLELSALEFYFQYLHRSLPRFFDSFNIATQGTQHSHDTLQCDQLRVDRSRINLADNRIRIFLPTLVNSTPLDLLHKITTHNIQDFSSHIKRYVINRYRDNCSNTNCYVCQY